jgi:hypothetical protein
MDRAPTSNEWECDDCSSYNDVEDETCRECGSPQACRTVYGGEGSLRDCVRE